jgi:2-methylcitrate dehydratase PrpD
MSVNPEAAPTRALAKFVHDLSYSDIPEEVRTKAKHLFLDFLGCALGSVNEEQARVLNKYATEEGTAPRGGSRILGTDHFVGTECAAFVNGANAHLLELDDTHRPTASHPGLALWATAVAVAERANSNGEDFLTAAIVGYEVGLRIASAVLPDHYVEGWNPSGTTMTFGAAAIAGRLLGLDEDHTAWALGLAGVQASGNRAHLTERVMTKDFNNGHAARCGVAAGLLASCGFTASTDELENRYGFLRLYGGRNARPEKLTEGLGEKWLILQVAHKPYPTCRVIHASLDALIAVRDHDGVNADDVASISSRVFAAGKYIVDDPTPWDRGKGTMGPRFSAQFNMAVGLLYGRPGLVEIFDPKIAAQRMSQPEVRDLMSRIVLEGDAALDNRPEEFWTTVVSVVLKSGRTIVRTVKYPLGEPENPIGEEGLADRFRRILSLVGWTPDTSNRVIRDCLAIDTLDDVGQFIRALPVVMAAGRVR